MSISDELDPRPILGRKVVHKGYVFDLVDDRVDLGKAGVVHREYIDHPGAVAVIVLNNDDEVLLVRQYRHPVRAFLWEPPAGLLDIAGEPAQIGAARELYEEADLRARTWSVLTDYFTTPGGNNEAIRIFLARDVEEVPVGERHEREHEELDMETRWVPLGECVDLVLGGHIHNPSAVVGILAAHAAKAKGWDTLRSVDAPWPYRRTAPLTSQV
ncbi:NUDIX domain-containing protein [Timonella senegalensis]|uniref:NUDIX domain-containing protein n=1 Tax=Timonella senegalensis TaxID=1465825 RepID=UPI0002E2061B|nr:NUDIX hydrolase [Timonella senegalensis]